MTTRAQRTHRLLSLQEQLLRVERWRLLDLQRRAAELDTERRELIAALNESDALQGLFLDATARRLRSIDQQAVVIGRQEQTQLAHVREYASRVACAERLSETVDRQAAREREKKSQLDVIERLVGSATPASGKIDPT
jgi:ssDNA-binding replication factor A large subunit